MVAYPERARINVDALRFPGEREAGTILRVAGIILAVVLVIGTLGIGLIYAGFFALFAFLAEAYVIGHIKGNSVRVTERQLPEVYSALLEYSQALGIQPPAAYVIGSSVMNAFALKVWRAPFVVVHSMLVDAAIEKGDLSEVKVVVAHELGHFAAGHLNSPWLPRLGGWIPFLYLYWSRKCEHTCDRVAVTCTGNAEPMIGALLRLTCGRRLPAHVSVDAVEEQFRYHGNEFFVQLAEFFSTHPMLISRITQLRSPG